MRKIKCTTPCEDGNACVDFEFYGGIFAYLCICAHANQGYLNLSYICFKVKNSKDKVPKIHVVSASRIVTPYNKKYIKSGSSNGNVKHTHLFHISKTNKTKNAFGCQNWIQQTCHVNVSATIYRSILKWTLWRSLPKFVVLFKLLHIQTSTI